MSACPTPRSRRSRMSNTSWVEGHVSTPSTLECRCSPQISPPTRAGPSFNDHPGALTSEQRAGGLAVAHGTGRTVLSWQASAQPGLLPWQLEHVPDHRAAVHQASGMVSVQAELSVGDSMTLLRAYAFAEDRLIAEIASDVVSGRLRFDESTRTPPQDR